MDGSVSSKRFAVGAVLETVTVTGAEVVRLPAASRATAVRVCEPLLAVVVSQETEYGALVALNPLDKAGAHFKLAQAYYASGQKDKAEESVLAALEAAPGYRPALEEVIRFYTPEAQPIIRVQNVEPGVDAANLFDATLVRLHDSDVADLRDPDDADTGTGRPLSERDGP